MPIRDFIIEYLNSYLHIQIFLELINFCIEYSACVALLFYSVATYFIKKKFVCFYTTNKN